MAYVRCCARCYEPHGEQGTVPAPKKSRYSRGQKKTYKYLQTYHLLEASEVALMLVPEFGLRLVV